MKQKQGMQSTQEENKLKVYSIFRSISGEVSGCPQGTLVTFVRFAGCNLDCSFCDAPEAKSKNEGREIDPEELFYRIKELRLKNVVLTGGEPFFQDQEEIMKLCLLLVSNGYKINIETNGSIPLVDHKIGYRHGHLASLIVDYKLEFEEQMVWDNYKRLTEKDFIKFVVSPDNLQKAILTQIKLMESGVNCHFAYSPMIPEYRIVDRNSFINLKNLVGQIVENINNYELEAIINVQLHKILGQR